MGAIKMTVVFGLTLVCLSVGQFAGSNGNSAGRNGHHRPVYIHPFERYILHRLFFFETSTVSRVNSLGEQVGALQNASSQPDDVISALQEQVASLQNETAEQQSALTTLTSQVDTLNATVVSLMEMVNNMSLPTPDLVNGTLRLVNDVNNSTNQGRVEIYINGMWGTICQDFWSKADAIVACNQLRLPSINPVAQTGAESLFGPGVGPIWLDNIICDGTELDLLACPTNGDGVGMTNCDHSQDVGLICQN